MSEPPPHLAEFIRETQYIARSYLGGLSFIVMDTARDPKSAANHLLSCLSQDLLQSEVSISALVTDGLLNVARRELRFLIEASVKIAAVQQASYVSTIEDKLTAFDKPLKSPSISIKSRIKLNLLPARCLADFDEEVGRLYGLTSNYVHLSPVQISQSIKAAAAGVTAGNERPKYSAIVFAPRRDYSLSDFGWPGVTAQMAIEDRTPTRISTIRSNGRANGFPVACTSTTMMRVTQPIRRGGLIAARIDSGSIATQNSERVEAPRCPAAITARPTAAPISVPSTRSRLAESVSCNPGCVTTTAVISAQYSSRNPISLEAP
jgi:hypothetical protein